MKKLIIKSIMYRDYITITKRKGVIKIDVIIDDSGNEFIMTQEELLNFLK